MEGLSLHRPLVFLDLETTGLSPASDRIVEIAVLKLHPDGTEEFRCRRVNPEIPIPPEATEVHNITDAEVAGEPPFRRYAHSLSEFLADCDVAGYNVARFDLPLLRAEFRRVGIDFSWKDRAVVDVLTIFRRKEKSTLTAAVKFYCNRDFSEGHSAATDVRAVAEVLGAQLARYSDLPRTVEDLHAFCAPSRAAWVDAEGKLVWTEAGATIAFGQHRGTPLSQLVHESPDYLDWILEGDFSDEVKEIVRDALQGRFPAQGAADEPAP